MSSMTETPVVGGTWQGAFIDAVHLHGDPLHPDDVRGVVLGYLEHEQEYVVWTYDSDSGFTDAVRTFDRAHALEMYANRVTARLFRFNNLKAPALTYLTPNPQEF